MAARTAAGPTSEQRREQILDAAMNVFARKGYSSATTKDIAHEIGVTPPLIYSYFETKRDLFKAILAERNPMAGSGEMLCAEESLQEPPWQLLRRWALDMVARMEEATNAPAFWMMAGEALRDPEVRAMFMEEKRCLEEILAAYLARQIDLGRLRAFNPTLAAMFFVGNLDDIALRRHFLEGATASYSPEQMLDALLDLLLRGLAPSGGPSAACCTGS